MSDFESRYQENPDPFGVRTSRYERRKLGIVLAGLTQERYRRAWDAACGTGDLALALTSRAAEVVATDAAPTAVRLTADLLVGVPHASAQVGVLPAAPARDVDLVVLSEVCYYLTAADREATYTTVDDVAAPDAELVAVTWRHHPGDAEISGEDATTELVEWFAGHGWSLGCAHDDVDFLVVHLVRGGYAPPRPGDDPTPPSGDPR